MFRRDPTLLLVAVAIRSLLQAVGAWTIHMYNGPTPGYDYVVEHSGLTRQQLGAIMAATAGLVILALNQRYKPLRVAILLVVGWFWMFYGSVVFLGDIQHSFFSPSAAFDVVVGLACSLLASSWQGT